MQRKQSRSSRGSSAGTNRRGFGDGHILRRSKPCATLATARLQNGNLRTSPSCFWLTGWIQRRRMRALAHIVMAIAQLEFPMQMSKSSTLTTRTKDPDLWIDGLPYAGIGSTSHDFVCHRTQCALHELFASYCDSDVGSMKSKSDFDRNTLVPKLWAGDGQELASLCLPPACFRSVC